MRKLIVAVALVTGCASSRPYVAPLSAGANCQQRARHAYLECHASVVAADSGVGAFFARWGEGMSGNAGNFNARIRTMESQCRFDFATDVSACPTEVRVIHEVAPTSGEPNAVAQPDEP